MRFSERVARFFYGRYGIDGLYYAQLISILVLWILRTILQKSFIAGVAIYVLEIALIVWMLFRCLSRNIVARRRENEKFLSFFKRIRNFVILQKNKIRDFKTYRYKKCPHCGAVLRLPKRKGTHPVVCPRCRERFEATTRI